MTFYKTLFARMGNIKAGKYVSDEGEDLNDTEKVLKKNGILLRDSTNEFRNFGDVLDEVASKWQNFDSVTQHAIATAFAGTRQQEKFFVLMENYGTALEYEAVAAESAGTANKKYTDAYLNNIQARKNAATAAFEQLSQTLLDSELVKGFYSALTGILNLLDKIFNTVIGKASLVIAAGAGIATLLSKIFDTLKFIWTLIPSAISQINLFSGATKGAAGAAATLSASWQGVFAIIGIVVAAFTAIISKLQSSIDEIRSKNQELVDTWNSEVSTASQLSRLYEKYGQLTREQQEYGEVEKQIVALLDDKTEVLSNLTSGTEAYSNAVKALTESELAKYKQDAALAASGAIDNMGAWMFKGASFDIGTEVLEDDKLKAFLESNYGDTRFAKQGVTHNGDRLTTLEQNLATYYEASRILQAMDNRIQELFAAGDTESINRAIAIKYSSTYADYGKIVKEAKPDIEKYLNSIVTSFAFDYTTVNGQIANNEDLEKAFKDIRARLIDNYLLPFSEWTDDEGNKIGDFTGTFFDDVIKSILKSSLFTTDASKVDKFVRPIQNLFDTLSGTELKQAVETVSELTSVVEEMDSSGSISLDTAQKLAELGEEYVDTISIENGKIKVNSDMLRMLAVRKLEDAKATAIQNGATIESIELYNKLIEDIQKLGSGDYLDRALSLRDYENTVLEFAGGADYDRRRLQNYYQELVDIRKQIDYLRNNGAAYDDPELMDAVEKYMKYANDWYSLQKEISDNDDDLYKSSIEKQNDALDKQKDLLEKIYDERKKALQLTKDENSYQKELASKQKKVADLQTQLITARLDTSASGRARVRALESELQKAQEELDDFNLEHAIEVVSDKLDAEKEENESIYERQKKDNEQLLNDYLANSKAELEALKNKLQEEYDIVNPALGDLTGENGVVSELEGIEGIVQSIEEKIGKDNVEEIPLEMHYATGREISGERKSDAYWDYKNKQVYGVIEKRHSGGIVGDLKLKDNETFAKLLKGEYVATPEQMSRFLNSTLPNLIKPKGYPEFSGSLVTINVESVNNETMPKLEALVKSAADKIKSDITSAFDKTGYRGTTKKVLSY